ncbi:MAG: hypothetical protein ACI8PT_004671 [Gammaproteobacteria bacterium]|jgi:hypothetical protein
MAHHTSAWAQCNVVVAAASMALSTSALQHFESESSMTFFKRLATGNRMRTMQRGFAWALPRLVLALVLAQPLLGFVANANTGAGAWVALCTAQGLTSVWLTTAGDDEPDDERQHDLAHCPACLGRDQDIAFLPASSMSSATGCAHGLVASGEHTTPHTSYAANLPPIRAPPGRPSA